MRIQKSHHELLARKVSPRNGQQVLCDEQERHGQHGEFSRQLGSDPELIK
jgi:hypothetical protein